VTACARLIPALLLLCAAVPAAADGFGPLPAAADLTFERVSLPDEETMGLLGAGVGVRVFEDWFAGLAAYGAATGRRGGFFTGGLALNWRPPVGESLLLDAGVFVGGGGGGSAPQGGGLMLRSHAGLALPTSAGAFGLGWARVDFPNGDIASNQVSLSFTRPFELLLRGGWGDDAPVDLETALPDRHHRALRQRVEGVVIRTWPRAGTTGVDGRPHDAPTALVGVLWESDVGEPVFLDLGAAGAVGGGADGYAQVMADLGVRLPLARSTRLVMAGGAGLGGGGRVDTGGGFLARVSLGLERDVGAGLQARVGGGLTGAPGGDYRTTDLHLAMGRTFRVPVATGGWRVPGSSYYLPRDLRVRGWQQWEWAPAGLKRKGGADERTLGLGGVAVDLRVGGAGYLTGQALAAHSGGAGGYAMGLVGGGLRWPAAAALDLELELTAGAAGGGGVDVDNGVVVQAAGAAALRLTEALRLRLAYGLSGPVARGLDRDVLQLGCELRFAGLSR